MKREPPETNVIPFPGVKRIPKQKVYDLAEMGITMQDLIDQGLVDPNAPLTLHKPGDFEPEE